MANEIYSSSWWGEGVCTNTIDWGSSYKALANCTPSFTNKYSLNFDGVDDYLDISNPIPLGLMSISFWMKSTDTVGDKGITNGLGQLSIRGTRPIVRLNSNNYQYFSDQVANFDGNWHHWFLLIAGSGKYDIGNCRLFVDSVEVSVDSVIANGNPLPWTVSQIGRGFYGSINASIDEFAIWQSDETANVSTIYNSGTPTNLSDLTTPPLHWYRNGDNGTWKSPQWLIPSNENKDKVSNYSFSFDGIDDYVDFGNPTELQITTDLSVSFWFKGSSTADQAIVAKDNLGLRCWAIWNNVYGAGNNLQFYISNSNSLTEVQTSANYNDGNWHNVVCIFKPSTYLRIYVDGVLDGENTTSIPATIDNDAVNLTVGAIFSSSSPIFEFEGSVDEVAIWNSDQSSNIGYIYSSGTPADLSSLSPVGYWRSENSTFSTNWTVTDNGSGSSDGTSANMTIEDRTGDAPNSTNNALSLNMDEVDRETDTP